jgi:tetratricopeptide (TPR) repeat protein
MRLKTGRRVMGRQLATGGIDQKRQADQRKPIPAPRHHVKDKRFVEGRSTTALSRPSKKVLGPVSVREARLARAEEHRFVGGDEHNASALRLADKVLRDKKSTQLQKGRAQWISAHVYCKQGDDERAFKALDEALKHAERAGDRTLEIACLNTRGQVHQDVRRKLDDARPLYEQAARVASETKGCEKELAIARGNLGCLEREAGNPELAKAHLEAAMEIVSAIGEQGLVCEYGGHLGRVCEDGGTPADLRAAVQAYTRTLDAAVAAGEVANNFAVVMSRLGLGRVHHQLGELEQAIEYFEDAKPCGERDKDFSIFPPVHLGMIAAQKGEDATAHFDEGISLCRELIASKDKPDFWASFYLALALVAKGEAEGLSVLGQMLELSDAKGMLGDMLAQFSMLRHALHVPATVPIAIAAIKQVLEAG